MQPYRDFAVKLAYQAGEIMKKNFALGMKKTWKKDNSPLTATDLAINKLVVDSVKKEYPDHGILGEEQSFREDNKYLWVCDPVDGTLNFSSGNPVFVFSLALVIDGKSTIGVIYDPILNRMVVAQKGGGTFLNGKKTRVSNQKQLQRGVLINIETVLLLSRTRDELIKKGCFVSNLLCISYPTILLACGEIAANLFELSKPWDAAATKIIVEEAGGKVTDLDGKEQRYHRPINGFIASNRLVHDELVKIIKDNK